MKLEVKYRTYFKGIAPRPIKLQIPGWAGEPNKHTDGDRPQPWHCPPFVSGSTYGLELIYPFDSECVVTKVDGQVRFSGDFTNECPWAEDGSPAFPPFMSFAPDHFGFTSSLDIVPPKDYVVRIEPHPRFYTDTTGEVPCAITGHIAYWWPNIFFVVFKTPLEGQRLVFRHEEPFAQCLILPEKVRYDIKEMTSKEAKVREERTKLITLHGQSICNNSWKDYLGHRFDDKYKVLQRIAKKGEEAIDEEFLGIEMKLEKRKKPIRKLPRRFFKGEAFQNKKEEK